MGRNKNGQTDVETRITELTYEVSRLTKERDTALTQAEQAEANRLAAESLLHEVIEGSTGALTAEIAQLQQQLYDLHAAIAEAESRKETARQVAEQLTITNQAARHTLQSAIDAQKTEERNLRAIEQAVQAARHQFVESQSVLDHLRGEAARLDQELRSYGTVEPVSCGCMFLLKKGPDCKPGAMITIITPCSSLGNEQPTNHVVSPM
ncbi:MAG TPA: hypothetical protein VFT59_00195 [Candidatus Saccharimonadales bacterium]|nr:hypothetical protein [Candidatus Saccharimonadales bacterium]